jgi:hypothetical protein
VGVLGLATASELSQLLIRSHSTDATTVVYAVAGGAAGAALVLSRAAGPRAWIGPAIAVWLAATLGSGLEPWRFSLGHVGTVGWVPFSHYFERTDAYALADAMMQILLYAPLGFLLAARDPGVGLVRAGLAGAAVGGIVEGGQLLLSGRVTDVTDVLLGGAGAAVGAWVSGKGTGVEGVAPDLR